MKTLEKLLAEYKIRFKETEEIDDATYPFESCELIGVGAALIGRNVEGIYTVRNGRGLVFYNGTWATAKITEKPKKWVVKKDEQHPVWERFKEWYQMLRPTQKWQFDSSYYATDEVYSTLLNFPDHQYLILDQWAELFLEEPKKYGMFSSNNFSGFTIDALRWIDEDGKFISMHGNLWDNFREFSPELSAMIEKEINQINSK